MAVLLARPYVPGRLELCNEVCINSALSPGISIWHSEGTKKFQFSLLAFKNNIYVFWLLSKNNNNNMGQDIGKLEPLCTVGGM